MIRTRILVVALVLGMALVSCLDGENKSTYRSGAVVVFSPEIGGLGMYTPFQGAMSIPELQGQDLEDGDCIYTTYTINYDKQPTGTYYTATDVRYQKLPKREVITVSGDMVDEYNDTIVTIFPSSSPYFMGNLFVQAVQKGSIGQQYKLKLICNTDSIDEKGVNTVFLKSTKSNESTQSNSVEINTMEAFDLNPLISAYGKDTTINEQKYRVLPLNIKYENKEGEYRQYGTVEVAVFK